MPTPRISTYSEFWPFYLGEHRLPLTRSFHFAGTTVAAGCIVAAVMTLSAWPLVPGTVAAYGCAWVSHFFIEKNRPATFTYPLWSFVSDWRMWGLWLTRRLDAELTAALPVKS